MQSYKQNLENWTHAALTNELARLNKVLNGMGHAYYSASNTRNGGEPVANREEYEKARFEIEENIRVVTAELAEREHWQPAATSGLLISFARLNHERVTAGILLTLCDAGVNINALHPRLEKAWGLFQAGQWQLPNAPECYHFSIDSSRGRPGNGKHICYLAIAPVAGKATANDCTCEDFSYQAQDKHAGFCKHVLTALIIYKTCLLFKKQQKAEAARKARAA